MTNLHSQPNEHLKRIVCIYISLKNLDCKKKKVDFKCIWCLETWKTRISICEINLQKFMKKEEKRCICVVWWNLTFNAVHISSPYSQNDEFCLSSFWIQNTNEIFHADMFSMLLQEIFKNWRMATGKTKITENNFIACFMMVEHAGNIKKMHILTQRIVLLESLNSPFLFLPIQAISKLASLASFKFWLACSISNPHSKFYSIWKILPFFWKENDKEWIQVHMHLISH